MKKYTTEDPLAYIASEPAVSYSYQHQSKIIEIARNGVSRAKFTDWSKSVSRSITELSDVLPASYSSLTKLSHFDKKTSEHILEIMQLFYYALDVFGHIDKVNGWLNSKSISLDNNTPFSLLDTSFGIEIVRREIGKIDYGLPV